jgi:type IV pilus assembly protein PilM
MSALGLHLKTNGFGAVEIEPKKPGKVLTNWAANELTNFSLDMNNDESVAQYTKALKEFLFDHNFKAREVIVSLPQDQVFVRTIKVPAMSNKEMDNFIKYESGQYIPIPLEEVTLGYDVMNIDLKERDKTNVLLVAAKKEVVRKYISIVKGANLTPRSLEPDSLAMTRSLGVGETANFAELIVDIGPKESLIVLAYKGFVILTRTIPLGEKSLTKSLAQRLDLDMIQARKYKETYGLDTSKAEGKIYKILQPMFDRLIVEIKKSKVFFTTHNLNVRIGKIIVSGKTALMPGLLKYMVNKFDVEVELANPWIKLDTDSLNDSDKKKINRMGPIFAVPVGLALKAE